MQEDYLHYLWEFQKWKNSSLRTSEDVEVKVLAPGVHNLLSGPDFFNSRIVIGEQQWAGNVEIHINSSDWYLHGHETDPAYDNVVLHVVWNHDTEIYRKDNSTIPVVELRSRISPKALQQYEHLLEKRGKKWINCEKDFAAFDAFSVNNWLERLYLERLEEKSEVILQQLDISRGDWEEVLFKMLARNFGLNINGDSFFSVACSIPFSVLKKCRTDIVQLEALFLGQAGLLEDHIEEPYYQQLSSEYQYLKKKFSLTRSGIIPVKYFRLRPDNFPEIRLAQLAAVYHKSSALFSELVRAESKDDLQRLFSIRVSEFWAEHYTFKKPHRKRNKNLSSSFWDLVMINTLVPIKFCYLRVQGQNDDGLILDLISNLKEENNQVVKKFNSIRPRTAGNALQSQALLHLKKQYCDRNRCLHCALGIKLLQNEQNN